MKTDSLKKIGVSAANMNDVSEKTAVRLTVHQLNAPSKIFRKRYWEQPDQYIMSREEYYGNFPHDVYADETDMTKWARAKKMFDATVTTPQDTTVSKPVRGWHVPEEAIIDIDNKNIQPGWYVAEALATDKNNDTVRDIRYFQVYDSKVVSPMASAAITGSKSVSQPGEHVNYELATNLEDVHAIQEIVRNDGSERKSLAPGKSSGTFGLDVSESDRGGIVVNTFFIKNNREYSGQYFIDVPFYNKELKIEYASFRDKTLPGAAEKWKVKISGYKGERVAAELLTAMYDASLDQFSPHSWQAPALWMGRAGRTGWSGNMNFASRGSEEKQINEPYEEVRPKEYDRLNAPEGAYGGGGILRRERMMEMAAPTAANVRSALQSKVAGVANQEKAEDSSVSNFSEQKDGQQSAPPAVQPRKNLNETAFFFPDLHTDSSGIVEFSFTTPEALTEWKWMLVAHTKDLAFASGEKTMITQKELMVQPNAPRFLREGDQIDFVAKIVNMSSSSLSGEASLELIDPSTGQPLDTDFRNSASKQNFSAAAAQSTPVVFTLTVPNNFQKPVSWRIIAKAKNLSDGEESLLPVISNRMLVTETMTLPMTGNKSKKFSFTNLIKSDKSKSLQQYALTVEFTSNPSWYAVQALPYLTEGKKENAEQIFNRFFANAVASMIVGKSPKIREIFSKWKDADSSALLSNLQKNEELKSVILEETPWVLEAKTESQQKKNIALLFDAVKMSSELADALNKLKDQQSPNGGFVWYKGGKEDRYMTQYILTGLGRLKQLGAMPDNPVIDPMIKKGIAYLDQRLKEDYEQLKKNNKKLPSGSIDYLPVQYLYMRSFFTDISVPGGVFAAYNYYRNESKQHG